MLKVGLTGSIASGKSVVGEMFVALGAHLTQADQIAHQLMQPGEPVYGQVVAHFGLEVLSPDGTINRAKLAEAAFGSPSSAANSIPSRLEELNRIVHPAVVRRQDEWMDSVGLQHPQAIAIVEAALILEPELPTVSTASSLSPARMSSALPASPPATICQSTPPGRKSPGAWLRNFPSRKKSRQPIS